MTDAPCPTKTHRARVLLAGPRQALPPALRMLLISVDGRRDLAALHAVASSLGLGGEALDRLRADGLIGVDGGSIDVPLPIANTSATAPVATPPARPDDELRRLVRAKMFALDLVGRMLAGRDAELRASAREVDSESRFLAWLDDATAHIAAAANEERAQFFRQRVAEAVS
jgi:hypothetical protein